MKKKERKISISDTLCKPEVADIESELKGIKTGMSEMTDLLTGMAKKDNEPKPVKPSKNRARK